MQQGLERLLDGPVAVSNMAQNAHTTTQEVIELMLQLRSGNVPDFVVFYDGFNDVWAAYESGIAGVHHSFDVITARIEGREDTASAGSFVQDLFSESNTWLLLTSLRERGVLSTSDLPPVLRTYEMLGVDRDSLAGEVAEICLQNYSLVRQMGMAYGFECLFVWQPVIWCSDKELTEHELEISRGSYEFYPAGADSALTGLLCETYDAYRRSMPDTVHYSTLVPVFDDIPEEIYTDHTGVHVSAYANGLIAAELLDLMAVREEDQTVSGDTLSAVP